MTATSVASSSQMFSASPFGQPSRTTTPVFNPFAVDTSATAGGSSGVDGAGDSSRTKRNRRNGRSADQSDSEGTRNPFINPFSDAGTRAKNQKGDERKRKAVDTKKGQPNGGKQPLKAKPLNSRDANSFSNPFAPSKATRNSDSRPGSSSSVESGSLRTPAMNSDDPHARKVYEQLRKDGISPPPWPSQPGNPKNKAEMAKFREKYEAYRARVRASLTKAGLIDDPSKRKTLQDAIDFKGICEDMCPDYEKIQRITEMDVHQPEKNPKTTFANSRRMVKKLARSAAGQEAPLPMDVRSIPALRRTLDYLIDDLLKHDGNLPALHGFLWDRTRAIRRDFTFFSTLTPEEMKTQVYVLENIARFHVTALHLLTQDGGAPEDFVEQQELEQLGKALLSLRDVYDDCNAQGIICENEAEFRAYYLIFHGFDPNILETLQRQWDPKLWRESDEVRTAVSLVEALQNTQNFHGPLKDAPSLAASAAYNSYFRIVEDPKVSYTMACFAECHFPHLRRCILAAVKKALARPKAASKDVTANVLNTFLRFDTVEEAIEFAELHDLKFGSSEEDPEDPGSQYLILDNRNPLPHHRLQHQFSESLVEKKRGSRSLPELIHESVYEDPDATNVPNGMGEGSLFVEDTMLPPAPTPISATQELPTTSTNPFDSPFAQPPTGPGGSTTTAITPGTTQNGIFSSLSQPKQTAPASNPFASVCAAAEKKPPVNPFASPTGSQFSSSLFAPSKTLNGGLGSAHPGSLGLLKEGSSNPFAPSSTPASTSDSAPAKKEVRFAPVEAPSSATPKPAAPSVLGSFSSPAKPIPKAAPLAESFERGSDRGTEKAPVPSAPTTTSGLQKTPFINITPPTMQPATSTFSAPSSTPGPFKSILGNSSIQKPLPSINGPLKATDPKSAKSTASELAASAASRPFTPPTPKPMPTYNFPSNIPTPTVPPTVPSDSVFDKLQAIANRSTGNEVIKRPVETPRPPAIPPKPPAPPRDLMGDFSKWFVNADNGLLEEFQAFMLDNILQQVFTSFQQEEQMKKRQEEENRRNAEADAHRVYSLSVKYLYRWRDNARELRLRQLRRRGRAQMRQYHEEKRAAELQAQRAAARQATRERAELADLNRPEELHDLIRRRKIRRRQTEADLLASGVLSGIADEREAISRIVNDSASTSGSVTSNDSKVSSASKGGSKTQALREHLLRDRSASFRRSLPSQSSKESSPDSAHRRSRVSDRWRLKAMGIIQLPDGTAVPESMAHQMNLGKKSYYGIGSMGPPNGIPARRASGSDLTRPGVKRTVSDSRRPVDTSASGGFATNKRKRLANDEGETAHDDQPSHGHKRVMSDATSLLGELRAMREEMEEGATWFREQNERLQSELASRGSTPWDQNV